MLETLSTRETGMLFSKNLNAAVLDTIGINGLDTQTHPTALDPEWLTKADNIVYTEGNRITFRKGLYQKTDAVGGGDHIGSLYEHTPTDTIYAAAGSYMYEIDLSDPDNSFINGFNTGATNDHWQFCEIQEGLVAVQGGEAPLFLDGSTWGLLSDESTYSKPAGVTTFDPSCGLGAFGRLWVGGVSESNTILYYSQIEDPPSFNQGDAGYIDLKYVWGNDEIVAIHNFGGKLAIFGKKNIALYNNPADVSNIYLDEVINGIGAVFRDSIQSIGNDIYFLSDTGVRSLYRTAQYDKLPLKEISVTVNDEIIAHTQNSQDVRSVYVLNEGLYLLSFTDINVTYVFDLTYITPRGTPRITKWYFEGDREPISFAYSNTYGLLFGEESGNICIYDGYFEVTYDGTDFNDTPFTGSFSTAVLDLGQGSVSSILKKISMVLSGGSGTDVGIKAFKDFELAASTQQTFKVNAPLSGTVYKWGASSSLFGAAKFAPIRGLKEVSIPLRGSAKYLRFEMDGVTNGYRTALQSLTLFYKQGKMY